MIKLNKFFKVLIICHVTLLKVSFVFPHIQSRIVGGTLTSINEAPFLVRLEENGEFCCGGTLVASRFVVTAASCVDGKNVNSFIVVAGVTHSFQTGERSEVDEILIPDNTVNRDVAVLKLRYPVYGERIQPIDLCYKRWSTGADVKMFGWGKVNETAVNVSNQMRTATVQVIEKSTCAYMHRNRTFVPRTMFCASKPGLKDACVGDRGGPAIINDQFCGVISWDGGCARNTKPSILISVLSLRRFLKTTLKALALVD